MNVLEFLHTRQSNPNLQGEAPDEEAINNLIKAGMRVPDHAGLTPWPVSYTHLTLPTTPYV